MILCKFDEGGCHDIERTAARLVEASMARRSSVCAVVEGIPLVTYPNDCRTPRERIRNLVLAFSDGWMRSQMENDSIQEIDTRFDPRFRCPICEIGEPRERALREMLEILASLVRRKLPDDDEAVALAAAAATILQGTALQRDMAEGLRKLPTP